MVSDEVNRLLLRAELFDQLAANITDARALEAARAMAREYRERAKQLAEDAVSNAVVEAPGSEEWPAQKTDEGGSVIPES